MECDNLDEDLHLRGSDHELPKVDTGKLVFMKNLDQTIVVSVLSHSLVLVCLGGLNRLCLGMAE